MSGYPWVHCPGVMMCGRPFPRANLGLATRAVSLSPSFGAQNTAARMESNSLPGHVRMTMSTASQLPPEVQEALKVETIDVKGAGSAVVMDASHLDGCIEIQCRAVVSSLASFAPDREISINA